ncbi:hypothetical protein AB1Y20_016456 [Prymnesium parvum]|uniref:PPM-type phosphatase domain-containing protein n=1 Tax=Prymnesium parvum TaxID=97485 RepID=A0AB34IE27_PRYPA
MAQVRAALERCELAPLAAAWRDVCEGYSSSGAQELHRHCRPDSHVVFATRDHSATDAAEIARITAAGGEVSCAHGQWRVKVESPDGSWLAALGGSECAVPPQLNAPKQFALIGRKRASEIAQALNQRACDRAGSTDNAYSIVLFL